MSIDNREGESEGDLSRLREGLELPLEHPNSATLEQWSHATVQHILAHWRTLPGQHVGRPATRQALEQLLGGAAPELGRPLSEVLAQFESAVAPHAVRVNHPRFFAFIPGAPSFPSVLGDWLCAGFNFFAGVWLEAAGPAQVELVVLDWFKKLLDCPESTAGLLTSGGSEANLTALAVARERLTFDQRTRAVVYVSRARHWSIDRAIKILGFRPDQLRPVPGPDDGPLGPSALAAAIAEDRAAGRIPWAVVANAGATSTGIVDPLADLALLCRAQGLWLHVDAAYGWPAVLAPEGRALLEGIGEADSITLDPHKWFAQTFEAGCLLVRDGKRLAETFALRPDYMQDVEPSGDEVNFADLGIALTRRFRALKIWFSVQVLGMSWFRRLVERSCMLAEYAEASLRARPIFQVMQPHRLSIVVFRAVPQGAGKDEGALDRLNLEIVDQLRACGLGFISSSRVNGHVALRFCFVNWRTTARDVDQVIDLLAGFAEEAASRVI
jgi:aromatic-L-amino-acid/L-tryptophan decarboxylase